MSDDKPGHVLTIPDSLGRDLDKAAEGKIAPPPIEAFMSDDALQSAQDATTAAADPVHAEDLRPISAAEAARRSTFGGDSLPNVTRRRVIPAPFARPRVNGGSHGKTWQSVSVSQVVRGDIIPDIGLVTDSREVIRRETVAGRPGVAVRTERVIAGAGGVVRSFRPDAQVRVFRAG